MIKMPRGSSLATRRKWWAEKSKDYPFHAEAPVSIRPENVSGDHASTGLRTGWRTWGFKTEDARDTFVVQYHARKLK